MHPVKTCSQAATASTTHMGPGSSNLALSKDLDGQAQESCFGHSTDLTNTYPTAADHANRTVFTSISLANDKIVQIIRDHLRLCKFKRCVLHLDEITQQGMAT